LSAIVCLLSNNYFPIPILKPIQKHIWVRVVRVRNLIHKYIIAISVSMSLECQLHSECKVAAVKPPSLLV